MFSSTVAVDCEQTEYGKYILPSLRGSVRNSGVLIKVLGSFAEIKGLGNILACN